jgi:hypothetical protein
MSARKGKNGFVRRRIVSSPGLRRNIRGRNASNFNDRKIGWMAIGAWGTILVPMRRPTSLEKA